VLYLSEVAHAHDGRAYCFGGGLYIDPVFPGYQVTALVGSDPAQAMGNRLDATLPPPGAIDYYGLLDPGGGTMPGTGDSVVFGFRPQAFVTQAYVVPLAGVATGDPRPDGIWHPNGTPAAWPGPKPAEDAHG
jgi:predicted amino acid racemase